MLTSRPSGDGYNPVINAMRVEPFNYSTWHKIFPLGQTNLICCFSSAPASTSNTPLQLSLLPFASGTPPINAINNHVMSRETSLMASAHGHLNNEVMNNNRPPAPKFRKWLMRNNKSSLSGLMWYRG